MTRESRAETKVKKEKETAEEMPLDLLADILSRIPAETLIRLKCVSKQWYNLISDPWFVNLHHHRSTKDLKFFQITHGEETTNGCCSFRFTFTDVEGKVLEVFSQKGRIRGSHIRIIGSVNGLICFDVLPEWTSLPLEETLENLENLEKTSSETLEQIYVCNPATRELLALPAPPPSIRLSVSSSDPIGFGYLPSTKEYKIIRCFWGAKDDVHCEIFSFIAGSNQSSTSCSSWKVLENKLPWMPRGASVFVNRCINWLYAVFSDQPSPPSFKRKILSFDLTSEKSRVLPVPSDTPGDGWLFLVNLGGVLSLVSDFSDFTYPVDPICTIWMLKDYAKCIWIKAYNIDVSSIHPRNFVFHEIQPMVNDQLLMIPSSPGVIYFYSIENEEFRAVEVPKHIGNRCLESRVWF